MVNAIDVNRPFGYRTFSLVTEWSMPIDVNSPVTECHSDIGHISTIRLPDVSDNRMSTVVGKIRSARRKDALQN